MDYGMQKSRPSTQGVEEIRANSKVTRPLPKKMLAEENVQHLNILRSEERGIKICFSIQKKESQIGLLARGKKKVKSTSKGNRVVKEEKPIT